MKLRVKNTKIVDRQHTAKEEGSRRFISKRNVDIKAPNVQQISITE